MRSLRSVLVVLSVVSVGCSIAARSPVHDVPDVREEAVTFRNGDVTLAGTFFVPDERGRHPAVVLFHGSGPEPRNRWTGRWFAAHGIAALAYDKRGVNESTGDFRAVSFTELAADGLAGVAWLKARADVNAAQIGVWGLSQGGWLGPLAASQSRDIAFVIAVSGPGVSPAEQMIFYYGNQLRESGFSDQEVAAAGETRRRVWHYLSTSTGADEARTALDRARREPWFATMDEQSGGLFGKPTDVLLNDPAIRARVWFRVEADYDPTVALRKLTVPALFIFGDQDQLVPVPRSVEIIRDTLTRAGHRAFEIVVFPGGDHIIRTPSSGGVQSPEYFATMAAWLGRTLAR
ncbi:MAG TPA: CocE/NonD family hydrolase [Vicinamibacterales bacterium]|nr:CocE/NonD family hydrolase [Vicinamibacterales bacterium]